LVIFSSGTGTGFLLYFYLLLFIPSPPLFSEQYFGTQYWLYPLIIGLFVTISGQVIRGATIGLAYIIRGGKDKKVYAEETRYNRYFQPLQKSFICRQYLMLLGVGILSNSLIYVGVIMPLFLFIYQSYCFGRRKFYAE
jgi:hypothetical protein